MKQKRKNARKALPATWVRAETRDKIVSIAESRDVPIAVIVREAIDLFLSKNANLINSDDKSIIEKGA